MTGLGFPESCRQFLDFTTDIGDGRDLELQYSDASLRILDSNYNTISQLKFWSIFPTSLSSLDFTATDTDVNFFTATATFQFLYMQILDKDGKALSPDYVNS